MGKYPPPEMIHEGIVSSFIQTNRDLHQQNFDVKFSGSTCTSVFVIGKKVYCANVGDSRTILVRVPDLNTKFSEFRENANDSNNSKLDEETKECKFS